MERDTSQTNSLKTRRILRLVNQYPAQNMSQKPAHVIAMDKAKIALMMRPDSAFFMTIVFSLKHVWDSSIPTARTNGKEIRYNPTFFLFLTQEERVFLMLHEAMHVAYMHMARLAGRNMRRWNIACDYVINLMLAMRGYIMPKGGLLDYKWEGYSAEQVYAALPENPTEQVEIDLIETDENDVLEKEVQDILVRASIQSKVAGDKPGTVPEDIAIYLDKLLNPVLAWHTILRRHMHAIARGDYSFRKPNRRFFPKHILPGLGSDGLDELAVAIDVSGSVSQHDFDAFISETSSILRNLKPRKLTILQFNTRVVSIHTVKSLKDFKEISFRGRGGTRIQPVIEWLNQHKPTAALVFSDGEFHFPDLKPSCPIIWTIHNNRGFKAPYGTTIHYRLEERVS